MVKTGRRTGFESIYEVAAQFRDAGFRDRMSVFTPGSAIWTAAGFGEVNRDFVLAPDTTARDFETKLRGQLAQTSDDGRQLMSELLAFHLLVTAVIGADKKLELIEIPLSMMGRSVDVPDDVRDVLGDGFINPGTYYNTGRPFQLMFLVRVGELVTSLDAEERERVVSDPWAFREAIDHIPLEGAASQRHALLHLLYPETFEAIVSTNHLDKIVEVFGPDIGGPTGDIDRDVAAIRERLEDYYGKDFDFYGPRLKSRWEQGTDPWAELVRWAVKLYQIDEFDELERNFKLEAAEAGDELREALDAGGDWLDQLRKSQQRSGLLDYRAADDFVQWVSREPEVARQCTVDLWTDDSGDLRTRINRFSSTISDGVKTPGNQVAQASFILMMSEPTMYPMYRPEPFKRFLALVGGTPRTSTPGDRYVQAAQTCDDLRAEIEMRTDTKLRDRLDAQALIWTLTKVKPEDKAVAGWSDAERTEFFVWRDGLEPSAEPDDVEVAPIESVVPELGPEELLARAAQRAHLPLSYFKKLSRLLFDKRQIVLYGPPGTGKTFVAQELALAIAGGDRQNVAIIQFHPSTTYEDFFEGIRPSTDESGTLRYSVQPGPLARIAKLAADRKDQRFVMVIDELNRANLPKVLGELLFLFEYRDRDMYLLYRPETLFRLPTNLFFIATMNTVDRSVALVDAAMRRRFHFVPFYPDDPALADVLSEVCSDDEAWVAELVEEVNKRLVEVLGSRDHQLGASHFIKAERTPDGIRQVWEYSIEPMIEDQLFGQLDRMNEFRWPQVKKRYIDDDAAEPSETDAPDEA